MLSEKNTTDRHQHKEYSTLSTGPQSKAKAPLLVSLLALIAVVLLLSSCATVGPDFQRPEAEVAPEWLETDDPRIKSEPAEHREWWKVFEDPILDSLIETAYQQNLTLQAAGIRILEARAKLGIAAGFQYPQVQRITGGATANKISSGGTNFDFFTSYPKLYSLGFDATWEIDFWGRFRRGVEAASANYIASIANYDDLLVTLTAEVARVYVRIRTLEQRLAVTRANVELQDQSLRLTETRFKYGDVTELDVLQARALLTDTQSQVPRLEGQLRQEKNGLSILLGTPPSHLSDMLHGPGVIPNPPIEVAVGIPADLLRRRPDIRRAELLAAAQSARIGIAKSELYPRLALLGSIGFGLLTNGTGSSLSDFFTNDSLVYSAGGGLQWPIFNYGRIKNKVRVQDARFQESVVNYQNKVLEAAREVEDAMVGFFRSQEEVKFLEDSVKALKRSVDLSLIQYKEGLVDYQRVIDNQRFLTDQQDVLASVSGAVNLSLVAMYKALGGGWQIRAEEDFVPEETMQVMRERTNWGGLLPPKDVPEELDPPPTGQAVPVFHRPDW